MSALESKKQEPLVVIGAGLMRTGTLSLKAALETLLNGDCYHLESVLKNPSHIDFFSRALEEKLTSQEWQSIFDHYRATVNFPATAFVQELMHVFPDAKVILTVRNTESWYRSFSRTFALAPSRFESLLSFINPFLSQEERKLHRLTQKLLQRKFGSTIFTATEEELSSAFEKHTEEVKRIVPKDKLLVYDVREGWGPLCRFLNVSKPDQLFPHLNSTLDFIKRKRRRERFHMSFLMIVIIAVFFSLFYQH